MGVMWLYQFKNRTVFDIVEDILDAASRSRPVTKSLIQRASGVRWDILDYQIEKQVGIKYLKYLE